MARIRKTGESRAANGTVTISVDAMGGDNGPGPIVAGMDRSAARNPDLKFVLCGPESTLSPLVARRRHLTGRVEIRDVPGVVAMGDKPSHAMRNGRNTSMWAAIDAVGEGAAEVCVSCGNTGALMAMSMIRLRKLPDVNRPAIAALWPSRNPGGFNVMLDAGADVRAEPADLLQYALMGTSYARVGLGLETPRVGLLNVGTEEHKGRAELKLAHDMIASAAACAPFEFVGYVEGGDLPSDRVDVIVTDGFTGNVALKTGEGTAKLIREFLQEAFNYSILSRIAALLAVTSMRRLSKRIDPRQVNGGVFLGLNGSVVKSHGSADATGVAAALKLAFELGRADLPERVAARVASLPTAVQSAVKAEQVYGNIK